MKNTVKCGNCSLEKKLRLTCECQFQEASTGIRLCNSRLLFINWERVFQINVASFVFSRASLVKWLDWSGSWFIITKVWQGFIGILGWRAGTCCWNPCPSHLPLCPASILQLLASLHHYTVRDSGSVEGHVRATGCDQHYHSRPSHVSPTASWPMSGEEERSSLVGKSPWFVPLRPAFWYVLRNSEKMCFSSQSLARTFLMHTQKSCFEYQRLNNKLFALTIFMPCLSTGFVSTPLLSIGERFRKVWRPPVYETVQRRIILFFLCYPCFTCVNNYLLNVFAENIGLNFWLLLYLAIYEENFAYIVVSIVLLKKTMLTCIQKAYVRESDWTSPHQPYLGELRGRIGETERVVLYCIYVKWSWTLTSFSRFITHIFVYFWISQFLRLVFWWFGY